MRYLPLLSCFLTLAACGAVSLSSTGRVGTDGWIEKSTKVNEYIAAEKPGAEVEIKAHGGGHYAVRLHLPDESVQVPVYPGAVLEETQERVLWKNRIYRIPGDGAFGPVYRWYLDWFAFHEPARQ